LDVTGLTGLFFYAHINLFTRAISVEGVAKVGETTDSKSKHQKKANSSHISG